MSPKAKCGLKPSVQKTSVAAGFLEALVLSEGFSSVTGFCFQLTSQEKEKRFGVSYQWSSPRESSWQSSQILWTLLTALLRGVPQQWSLLETQSSQLFSTLHIFSFNHPRTSLASTFSFVQIFHCVCSVWILWSFSQKVNNWSKLSFVLLRTSSLGRLITFLFIQWKWNRVF